MTRVEGAFGRAASSDTTAVTRPAQNKPETDSEEGEGVSDCPGISPPLGKTLKASTLNA